MRPAVSVVKSFVAGSLVAVGLVAVLVLFGGWGTGLTQSGYAALCGALVGGARLARRDGGPPGPAALLGAGLGVAVALWVPAAAWKLSPLLGYGTGAFRVGPQAMLGLVCGLGGVLIGRRRFGRPSLADEAARLRRERRSREG